MERHNPDIADRAFRLFVKLADAIESESGLAWWSNIFVRLSFLHSSSIPDMTRLE